MDRAETAIPTQAMQMPQDHMAFLQAQLKVAQVALSSLQPEVLEPALLEAIGRAQAYSHGFFWRLADDGQHLRLVRCYGTQTRKFLGRVIQARQPLYVKRRAAESVAAACPDTCPGDQGHPGVTPDWPYGSDPGGTDLCGYAESRAFYGARSLAGAGTGQSGGPGAGA